MPLILKSSLRLPATFSTNHFVKASRDLRESANVPLTRTFDIFLSHSYADAKGPQSLDAENLLALRQKLEGYGYSVYVDWMEDRELDRSQVNRATAERLRQRMDHCTCLLYATTQNAVNSKWMPWEMGYFDGRNGKVAVLPVALSPSERFTRPEYLSLYPYVDENLSSETGTLRLWVKETDKKYIVMDGWMQGYELIDR